MRQLFYAANGHMPTTAALTKVTTGTAIKTLLQIAVPSSARDFYLVEWGISFDGSSAATPIEVEALETDVGATITQFVAADLQPYNNNGTATSGALIASTTQSGFTATAEGSITTTRYADLQLVAPSNQYVKQYPLGSEFVMRQGKFFRIRVTAPAAVNAYAYAIWSE